jgi:hypothetical protein
MPSDVIFPDGCAKRKRGKPCDQGEEKLICRDMCIRTKTMFNRGEKVAMGNVVEQDTGLSLESAIQRSALHDRWECYFCGTEARYIPDIRGFYEAGGMALLRGEHKEVKVPVQEETIDLEPVDLDFSSPRSIREEAADLMDVGPLDFDEDDGGFGLLSDFDDEDPDIDFDLDL